MKKFFQQLLAQNAATLASLVLLVIVPLLGSSALLGFFYRYGETLRDFSWWQELLYFLAVALTMAFALTPTTFVAIVSGFYFGWSGFPAMVASYAFALLIARFVANRLDHGKLWGFLHKFDKVSVALHELDKQQFGLIVMSRLSPVLPFAFMNFVLSLMQVRRRDYLLGSLLGMLPRTTLFYLLGTQGQRIYDVLNEPGSDRGYQLFVIGLVIVSMIGLFYYFNRAIQKALKKKDFHSSEQPE